MRKRVYLSGPITMGDKNQNLNQANRAHDELIQAGWAVFNPMLSMLNLGAQQHLTWDEWLENDEAFVAVCDIVCRLPGGSAGAERECEFARRLKIPVVGPYYFECLRDLFPEENVKCYTLQDRENLWRYNRAERRAAGLPARAEGDPRLYHSIVEGFASVR